MHKESQPLKDTQLSQMHPEHTQQTPRSGSNGRWKATERVWQEGTSRSRFPSTALLGLQKDKSKEPTNQTAGWGRKQEEQFSKNRC